MLSGIANLIFGATPLDEETVACNQEVNLKVTPVENEWALVDKHENGMYGTCGRVLLGKQLLQHSGAKRVNVVLGQRIMSPKTLSWGMHNG
jgi:hypothetical protein